MVLVSNTCTITTWRHPAHRVKLGVVAPDHPTFSSRRMRSAQGVLVVPRGAKFPPRQPRIVLQPARIFRSIRSMAAVQTFACFCLTWSIRLLDRSGLHFKRQRAVLRLLSAMPWRAGRRRVAHRSLVRRDAAGGRRAAQFREKAPRAIGVPVCYVRSMPVQPAAGYVRPPRPRGRTACRFRRSGGIERQCGAGEVLAQARDSFARRESASRSAACLTSASASARSGAGVVSRAVAKPQSAKRPGRRLRASALAGKARAAAARSRPRPETGGRRAARSAARAGPQATSRGAQFAARRRAGGNAPGLAARQRVLPGTASPRPSAQGAGRSVLHARTSDRPDGAHLALGDQRCQ